ncbi:MAG: hypothetical protein DHS20C02_09290 [Micavibrio sp.]|nr:MAG: hypothetical protein DHS20C02_09290 [Micavibrio sp.]
MLDKQLISGSLTREALYALKGYTGHMPSIGKASLCTVPPGDGGDVLLLPGFLENDRFMRSLAESLKTLGYKPHFFEKGINFFPPKKALRNLEEAEARLDDIYFQNGNKKVSLVGHSGGGLLSLYLAFKHHHKVKKIIMQATPTRISLVRGECQAFLSNLFMRCNKNHPVISDPIVMRGILESIGTVPTTSIIDISDPAVNALTCVLPNIDGAQSIVINGDGHVGILANLSAHILTGHALAQPWDPVKQSGPKLNLEALWAAGVNIDLAATREAQNRVANYDEVAILNDLIEGKGRTPAEVVELRR